MSTTSFLPEDYLAKKAEYRTNLISLVLFAVVMFAVVLAFFVTNRKAQQVKDHQAQINTQYQQAGLKIQELTELEGQKVEMLTKAELAGALVERVPRSILLAELINRMPERLALLEFDLKSEKVKPPAPPTADGKDKKGKLSNGPERGKTMQEANQSVQKIDPPKFKVVITMLGVAPTDLEVSKYMSELSTFAMLRDVALEYSEEKALEGRTMRQFKISMALDSTADVRRIDPLAIPRIRNPMTDNVQYVNPGAAVTGSNTPQAPSASPQAPIGAPSPSKSVVPGGTTTTGGEGRKEGF